MQRWFSSLLIVVAAAACKGTDTPGMGMGDAGSSPSPAPTIVLGSCPEATDEISGKVQHLTYLRDHPNDTHAVSLKLREILPAVAECPVPGTAGGGCPERDQSLLERQKLNQQQVDCVTRLFPSRVSRAPFALWYEAPRLLSSGRPVPIGLAFSIEAPAAEVESAAAHPYVERVVPAPGQALSLGLSPPAVPAECAGPQDEPGRKLERLGELRNRGRQAAVIEMKDAGLLPAVVGCPQGTICEEAVAVHWMRTILNRRHVTCVRSWLDGNLKVVPGEVDYAAGVGALAAPALPPFGQVAGSVKAFGLGLTWEEAMELAKLPYVESIWTSEGIQIKTPQGGCLPDLSQPVRTLSCPEERESGEGKIDPELRKQTETTGVPAKVQVVVRFGAKTCSLPPCPGGGTSCPERERYVNRWQEENDEAQRCVRALITALGGSHSDEKFGTINMFVATLTWAQVQLVSAHPHVERLDASQTSTPPP